MSTIRLICFCNEVSDRQILHAIRRKGARSVDDVQKLTGAGKDCGRCKPKTQILLNQELPKIDKENPQLRLDFGFF